MDNGIISEYKKQVTFIDKYKFYRENEDEIRFIEPSNSLMMNFEKASKEINDLDVKDRKGRAGAIIVNMTDEHLRLQESRKRAIEEIEYYYKENDLNEPLPINSFEHGQVIEFEVSQYPFEAFESLRDGFLLVRDGYHIEDGRKAYLQKRLNDSLDHLKGFKFKEVDLTNLVRHSMRADKLSIDFQLLFEDFTIKKIESKSRFNSEKPFYENLAKVIPYVFFIDFLEGLNTNSIPKSKPNISEKKSSHLTLMAEFKKEFENNKTMTQAKVLTNIVRRIDKGLILMEPKPKKWNANSIRKVLINNGLWKKKERQSNVKIDL